MAAIKMDELLVSWLGSDDVYEKVLNLIERNRSSHSSSNSPNLGGNNNNTPKRLQTTSSNMELDKDNNVLNENRNDVPNKVQNQDSLSARSNNMNDSDISLPPPPKLTKKRSKKTEIPPFYTPNEGGRGRGRRPSPSSDQSWNSVKEKIGSLAILEDQDPSVENAKFRNDSKKTGKKSTSLDMDAAITMEQFLKITKDICGFPSFFNGPLYRRILHYSRMEWQLQHKEAQQNALQYPETITVKIFKTFWEQEMEKFDASDRFFRLVKSPNSSYITKDDFLPYMEELLNCHPGLEFLSNHAEFQEKYAITVITRIFYSVNTCHNGKITCRQIRKSDLLEAFHAVDAEDDINKITRYFSYEHFYVLYCRFWELDHDRDYRITRDDLSKYGEHSLSHMIVDRIFDAAPRPFHTNNASGVSTSNKNDDENKNNVESNMDEKNIDSTANETNPIQLSTSSQDGIVANNNSNNVNSREYLSYEDFIFFMLSEEDKANEISVRYWFSCVDVDGDGKLNNMEMRSFYAVQLHRMQCLGHDIVPFEDMLCQMIDMIKPGSQDFIVVEDFLQPECCQVSGALFDALFNLNKYLQFEQRDPFMERQKREDEFESDWDRFAYIDYNRLAMEEEAREEEAMEIDWVTVDDDDDDDDGDDFNSLGLGGASEAPF